MAIKITSVKNHITVEGLVLRGIPFKERSTIVTLFTKESGIKSCVFYASTLSQKQLITPLCHGEFILKSGKGMERISDGTIYSLQLQLRSSYRVLQTAGLIASILYETQLENKPAPELFLLTQRIFKKLPEYNPTSMHACFLVKLLLHEGAFSPFHPHEQFTHEEWRYALRIAESTSFRELPVIPHPIAFIEKLTKWARSLNSR